MVVFLFVIALKVEEENGLGDFACGALVLGGGKGHRGVRRTHGKP